MHPNEDYRNKTHVKPVAMALLRKTMGYYSKTLLPGLAHFTTKIAGLPPARFLEMTVGLYRQ